MSPKPSCNPVLARVIRGGEVESIHRGSAVVKNAAGETVFSIGDTSRSIFPRSSYKFFQAIPLVESGAVDALDLDQAQLALACASHNGEPMHADRVASLLSRLGLAEEDLECGPALPSHVESAHHLIRERITPGRRHHNCSGKHVGMLALAKHLGLATRGYSEFDHPTQVAWRRAMTALTGVDTDHLPWDRDGCGMPALYMPMDALATGFARFADPAGIPQDRAAAMKRILDAVAAYPEMLAGSGRCCTAVIRNTGGRLLVKTGADGVYSGVVRERGVGFVLKVDDGATRGSEVALGGLLKALDLLSDAEDKALAPWFRPDVLNSQGRVTGRIEPVLAG